MKRKFAKTIAVRWEGEDETPYMAAYEKVEDTANLGSTETVALYRLEHVLRVTTEVSIAPVRKRG